MFTAISGFISVNMLSSFLLFVEDCFFLSLVMQLLRHPLTNKKDKEICPQFTGGNKFRCWQFSSSSLFFSSRNKKKLIMLKVFTIPASLYRAPGLLSGQKPNQPCYGFIVFKWFLAQTHSIIKTVPLIYSASRHNMTSSLEKHINLIIFRSTLRFSASFIKKSFSSLQSIMINC